MTIMISANKYIVFRNIKYINNNLGAITSLVPVISYFKYPKFYDMLFNAVDSTIN